MTPPAWHDLLQAYLDGDHHAAPAPCGPRDREAVEGLLAGLDRLARPALPPDLTARITATLREEASSQRRRRWRTFAPMAGLVAAASLLLALGLRVTWPVRESLAPPRVVARAEPFRDSMNRAGTALAALTTQTAETTVENTSSLLPLVNSQALPPMPTMPPIEPPLEPFREASEGVSTGLAPVTESARRAVNLFMRDLPVVRSIPHKPG